MAPVIDFHVHVFPDPWTKFAPDTVKAPIQVFRKQARMLLKPVSSSIHKASTFLRYLPESARRKTDGLGALTTVPGLLVEATASDLRDVLTASGVDGAVVIAAPPIASNEFILELCQENPGWIAAVNIPPGTSRPAEVFKRYLVDGARILKIHPAADGEGVDSPRYHALLKAASEEGTPVILHTGCVHSHLLYKAPDQGRAEKFVPWFKAYPDVRFVLAHMNFHEPHLALDLAEEYPNLFVDTSWQPSDVIGEAARRIGAERVLYGTDWPLGGDNIAIGLARVRECLETGMLNEEQSRLILGENAVKLLGIDTPNAD